MYTGGRDWNPIQKVAGPGSWKGRGTLMDRHKHVQACFLFSTYGSQVGRWLYKKNVRGNFYLLLLNLLMSIVPFL